MTSPARPDRAPRTSAAQLEQLSALSNGVFAIAMTVLALELAGAVEPDVPIGALLRDLLPAALAYLLSFVILGLFWFGQRTALSDLAATDRWHAWSHIGFLMMIAIIPFPAALVGAHPDEWLSLVVYAGVLTAAASFLEAGHVWAHRPGGLAVEGARDSRAVTRRLIFAVLTYGLALLVGLASPPLGLLVFVASHLAFIARPVC